MKKFKPMLAPNESVDLSKIKYPILGSFKMDGVRMIFDVGRMFSRSLKEIPNIQIHERYNDLKELTNRLGIKLDGEFYSHVSTFQMIQAYTRTENWNDNKVIKKYGKVLSPPDDFGFYCFDMLKDDVNVPFSDRCNMLKELSVNCSLINIVEQFELNNEAEVKDLFKTALNKGYEGLILKSGEGHYKFGRGTINEGLIYKVKLFKTFDAKIIDVMQATKVRDGAEKKVNELGRSVTSKKKGDRIPIDRAACFKVLFERNELDVVIAMKNDEKDEIWKNRVKYIGKWIEYKAMEIGAKDVPRHPVMVRFREDLDNG